MPAVIWGATGEFKGALSYCLQLFSTLVSIPYEIQYNVSWVLCSVMVSNPYEI